MFQHAPTGSRRTATIAAPVWNTRRCDCPGGPDRETARVRLGVLDYLAYNTDAAYRYLSTLDVTAAEPEAPSGSTTWWSAPGSRTAKTRFRMRSSGSSGIRSRRGD